MKKVILSQVIVIIIVTATGSESLCFQISMFPQIV